MFQRLCHACSAFAAIFAMVIFTVSLWSQAPASAPVPPEVSSAKTIFLANGGEDEFVDSNEAIGVPQRTYDRVYAAVTTWGRYKVVGSPEKADLVLEVRSRLDEEKQTSALFKARRIDYRLLDRASHMVLWGGSIHIERAARQRTLDRNLNDAIDFLVNDLKRLVDRSATSPT